MRVWELRAIESDGGRLFGSLDDAIQYHADHTFRDDVVTWSPYGDAYVDDIKCHIIEPREMEV